MLSTARTYYLHFFSQETFLPMSGPGVLCEGLGVTEIFGAYFQQRGVGTGLVESRTGRLFAAGASEVFESSRIIFYFISRFLVMSSNYQTSFPKARQTNGHTQRRWPARAAYVINNGMIFGGVSRST